MIIEYLQDGKIIQNDKNYILLDTHKAGVRFRNRNLTDLNDDYSCIHDQYTEQQKSIVDEVIKIASKFVRMLFTRITSKIVMGDPCLVDLNTDVKKAREWVE